MSLRGMYTSRVSGIGSGGFTLVEVLVAVLVLGIGLLGLAGMQVAGLRNNQGAFLRSQATQLAYDMADRVRANPQGLATYNSFAESTDDCRANSCTPEQMAGFDIKQWEDALAKELPGGSGIVCLDNSDSPLKVDDGTPTSTACSGGGSLYAIKIWWDEQRTGNSDTYQRFVMTFQP